MSLSQSDLAAIRELLQREPTPVEYYIFDAMWSEHCSYKSSKAVLKANLPTQGSEVALGIGEDSGIIRFVRHDGKQYCLAISHESHNHPSQILPIEGAATGVGGVVRDVYCMGADVIGVLNSLHFGISDDPQSVVHTISKNVVLGVSDYANPLGVPVLGGETVYHPSYNDNCLVNVAAIGLIEESKIIHSYVPDNAQTEPYDIILFGKSTDATGFGGASFSSATLDKENDVQNVGAVQVHDPFLKRVLVEAIKTLLRVVDEKKVPIGFKDLGAGGICCATSEIAVGAGMGVEIDLDNVNVALTDLKPEVIACSETQERFCLAVPRWFSGEVLKIFNDEFALPSIYPNAGAAVIGQVIHENRYLVRHRGAVVADLPVSAITTEVTANRVAAPRPISADAVDPAPWSIDQHRSVAERLMGLPNMMSKRFVFRHFDNAVRGDTVVYPGEADSVLVTPIEGCPAAVAVSMDSNLYGKSDPYVSGAYAVAEAVRNVIAVGGRPLCVTDCLNFGNPENPDAFFEFCESVRGIGDASRAFGFIPNEPLPVISGNVSLYNESKTGSAVIPSPVIVVIGRVDDYRKATVMSFPASGLNVIRVGKMYPEFGGTQIQNLVTGLNDVAPQVRFDPESRSNMAIFAAIDQSLVAAAHDISGGGTLGCIFEMCFGLLGNDAFGATLSVRGNAVTELYAENGGYIVAVHPDNLDQFEQLMMSHGVEWTHLGETTDAQSVDLTTDDGQFVINLSSIRDVWNPEL
ncbi:phosphoribosylformylglycinamidine synthase subunit PurL [bacterium]|nr:phosphoribosylformylglycinamidine synthase subunit PurL [bacterium]